MGLRGALSDYTHKAATRLGDAAYGFTHNQPTFESFMLTGFFYEARTYHGVCKANELLEKPEKISEIEIAEMYVSAPGKKEVYGAVVLKVVDKQGSSQLVDIPTKNKPSTPKENEIITRKLADQIEARAKHDKVPVSRIIMHREENTAGKAWAAGTGHDFWSKAYQTGTGFQKAGPADRADLGNSFEISPGDKGKYETAIPRMYDGAEYSWRPRIVKALEYDLEESFEKDYHRFPKRTFNEKAFAYRKTEGEFRKATEKLGESCVSAKLTLMYVPRPKDIIPALKGKLILEVAKREGKNELILLDCNGSFLENAKVNTMDIERVEHDTTFLADKLKDYLASQGKPVSMGEPIEILERDETIKGSSLVDGRWWEEQYKKRQTNPS